MVRYTLEQRVFLYDTYVKYRSARKCQRKLRRKFCDEQVPSKQTIHKFVTKLRTTGLLMEKKQKKNKHRILTENLYDIGPSLEHTPRKSLKHLVQETGCQSLVQEQQHNCWSLDPIKQQ
jgi:hypothetical protein